MNKPIFCLVGESGSGKSTYLDLILNSKKLNVKELKYFTTRRKRYAEENSYYFVNNDRFIKELQSNNIIEYRDYSKYDEKVTYFTTYDNLNVDDCDGLICAASVDQVLSYIKKLDNVYVIDLKVELLKERIKRLLDRAHRNEEVLEICRRVLEEQNEYEKLQQVEKNIIHIYNDNTKYRFDNTGDALYACVTMANLRTIIEYIKERI